MERLTTRMPDGTIKMAKSTEVMCFGDAQRNLQQIIERLADYEDLEITAEQVRELDRICTEKMQEVAELRKQIPPCKVGDIVWDNDFGKPCSYEVTGFSYGDLGDSFDDNLGVYDQIIVYYKSFSSGITGSFAVSEIGKSVFLTKEAAEHALKEMEKKE